MKCKKLIWVALVTLALSGCDAGQSGISQSAANGEAPADFSGDFTLGDDCSAMIGTMSVRSNSIRVGETVCQIKSSKHINTSVTEYTLSDCLSEGVSQSNRKVEISEVEDGQVLITGWSPDDFTFDMCG